MLIYHRYDSKEHISVIFESKYFADSDVPAKFQGDAMI